MKSLQQRISVALVISLIIIFTTLWWLTNSTMQDIAEKYVVSHLAQEAENLLATMQVDKDETITLDTKQINPAYLQPFSGQYYQLHSDDNVIRSRSLWDKELLIPKLAEGEKRRLYLSGPRQQSLLVMVYGYYKHDRPIVIAVAEDISPTLAFIKPFQSWFMLIALAMLLLLIATQVIILRSLFSPFKHIRRQIEALEQYEIDRLDTDVPQEVSPLVDTVNHLLDALEQQPEQRAYYDDNDPAYSLAPPENELRQLPDEQAIQSGPEDYHSEQEPDAGMEHAPEPVFESIFPDDRAPSVTEYDIEQEILTLISVLESLYQEKNLDIDFIMPQSGILLADSEDMLELSGSLLKNACKWAQSRVRLKIEIDDAIHLKVEDDRPDVSKNGIPDPAQQNILLDQAAGGYGLGLTAAQLIAQQHGGQLKLSQSEDLGGYCMEVILPLA